MRGQRNWPAFDQSTHPPAPGAHTQLPPLLLPHTSTCIVLHKGQALVHGDSPGMFAPRPFAPAIPVVSAAAGGRALSARPRASSLGASIGQCPEYWYWVLGLIERVGMAAVLKPACQPAVVTPPTAARTVATLCYDSSWSLGRQRGTSSCAPEAGRPACFSMQQRMGPLRFDQALTNEGQLPGRSLGACIAAAADMERHAVSAAHSSWMTAASQHRPHPEWHSTATGRAHCLLCSLTHAIYRSIIRLNCFMVH